MASNVSELIADVEDALKAADSTEIDPDVFERTGIFVVRSALPKADLSHFQKIWDDYRSQTLGARREIENKYNPVEIKQVPDALFELTHNTHLLEKLTPVFGDNIGLYQKRFVVKDQNSTGPVILHQDSGYHVGTFEKASMFLALKTVNKNNGAMYLYPGTHRFGYLGDAGSINPDILPEGWPAITPSLEAGDFLLMKSLTWHGSGPFIEGNERVMTDFIFQNASDPSTREVVKGEKGWSSSFLTERRPDIFLQCRSSKLRDIKGVLDSTTQ